MKIKSLVQTMALSAVASLMLIGCGGGSDSTPVDTTQTGTFVDAPVKGLRYITATQNGYTNDSGEFSYKSGETVEFRLGNLSLGTVTAGELITPYTIAGDTNISDPSDKATNIAMLLQSFDGNRSNTAMLDVSKLQDANLSDINISATVSDMTTKIANKFADNSFSQYRDTTNNTPVDATTAKNAMKAYVEAKQIVLGYFTENNITYAGNVNMANSADLLKQTGTSLLLASAFDGPIASMKSIRPNFVFETLVLDGSNINYSADNIKLDWGSSEYTKENESDTISKVQFDSFLVANGNTLTENFGDGWIDTNTISSVRYVSSIAGISLHKGVMEVTYKMVTSGTAFDNEDWTIAGNQAGTATTIADYVNQAITNSWGRDGYCWVVLGENGTIVGNNSTPITGASWKIENNTLIEVIPNCRDAKYIFDNGTLKQKWNAEYLKKYVGITKEEANAILKVLIPTNTLVF